MRTEHARYRVANDVSEQRLFCRSILVGFSIPASAFSSHCELPITQMVSASAIVASLVVVIIGRMN